MGQNINAKIQSGWLKITKNRKPLTKFQAEDLTTTPKLKAHKMLEKAGIKNVDERNYCLDVANNWLKKQKQKQQKKTNKNHTINFDNTLKGKILQLMASNQKTEATEIMVQEILNNEHIYTIRDDREPQLWIYKKGIYIPNAKTYIQELVRNLLEEAYTTYQCNQVISKIQADTYIEQEKFFKQENPKEVCVENGVLNLKTKKLTDYTPDKKFFTKIPIKYKPGKKCPAIKKFLSQILHTKNDVKVMQEIFGFLLWDEYFIEKAFMFLGKGRNGKGKTIKLMKKFLGAEACVEVPLEDLEKDEYAKAELHKKKANLCGDLSKTALKNTGHFKKLVGRDLISAQQKFKPRVSFVNYAKLVFAANQLPITYDLTLAFFNRWVILDFPYTFLPEQEIKKLEPEERKGIKKQDPHIIDKIVSEQELSGLLNWALKGLERLLKREGFSNSDSIEAVKRKWLRKSDSCNAFVMDCVESDFDSYIEKSEFREKYHLYCAKHKLEQSSDRAIKYVLNTSLGVSDAREYLEMDNGERKQVRVWKGLDWKDGAYKYWDQSVKSPLEKSFQSGTESPVLPDLDFDLSSFFKKEGSKTSNNKTGKTGIHGISTHSESLILPYRVKTGGKLSLLSYFIHNLPGYLEKNEKIDLNEDDFSLQEERFEVLKQALADLSRRGLVFERSPGVWVLVDKE